MTKQELSNIAADVLEESAEKLHQSLAEEIANNAVDGEDLSRFLGKAIAIAVDRAVSEAVSVTLTTLIRSGSISIED